MIYYCLIRFDIVYYGLFECNRRQIADYPNLSRYLQQLYAIPELNDTVNFDHIKQGFRMLLHLLELLRW